LTPEEGVFWVSEDQPFHSAQIAKAAGPAGIANSGYSELHILIFCARTAIPYLSFVAFK
jgi:hypothetical protein